MYLEIDVDQPEKANWKVIVPEADEAMESAGMVGDYLIVEYLKDAKTQVKLFDLNGKFVREVEFPGIGSASGFGGRRDHTETFYSFSSFNRPPSIYRYDLNQGKSTLIREAKVDFDPEDYDVKQVFYKSKDGTKVPMFIAHKKGLELNGKNPTLLYAYGGFNISLTPSFSIPRLQWMEMGGVFAMPNLRGGGEYGKEWHKAGTTPARASAHRVPSARVTRLPVGSSLSADESGRKLLADLPIVLGHDDISDQPQPIVSAQQFG